MGTVTTAAIRQRVATAIGVLGSPWSQGPYSYDLFGEEPASIRHGAFAVGIPSSGSLADRQKPSSGGWTKSQLAVRFFWRASPKDQIIQYDRMLAAEQDMIAAVVARTATYPGDCSILWSRTDRTLLPTAPEWYRVTALFDAYHVRPLQ